MHNLGLKEKKSHLSPEKVIEIIQNIFEITLITPNNEPIRQIIILSEEQRLIKDLFGF